MINKLATFILGIVICFVAMYMVNKRKIDLMQDFDFIILETLFADDAAIYMENAEDVQNFIYELEDVCIMFGIRLSESKTEIIFQGSRVERNIYTCPKFKFRSGGLVKIVKEFRYLGEMISCWRKKRDNNYLSFNNLESSIKRRIFLTNWAFNNHKRVLKEYTKPLYERLEWYIINVQVYLTQVLGVRSFSVKDLNRLEAININFLRIILGNKEEYITMSYIEIYKKCNMLSITSVFYKDLLLWIQKINKELERELGWARQLPALFYNYDNNAYY